jgi:hypothetical protein
MSAYIRNLNASLEAELAVRAAQREEIARAEVKAARERLLPLDVRLKKLLGAIPAEVQAEGLSLETIRIMLRGDQGRAAHGGALGEALRRLGYIRERRWRAAQGAFKALWYPGKVE